MLALGMLEFKSIAKGIYCADQMLKAANVELLIAQPICPGKYLVGVGGDVSAVNSSIDAGIEESDVYLLDQLIIPNLHPQVIKAISGTNETREINALGIIETFTVTSTILAADAGVKAADVDLIEIRVARGLGGKAYVSMCGDVSAVNSSIKAGLDTIKENSMVCESIVIPNLHNDLKQSLL